MAMLTPKLSIANMIWKRESTLKTFLNIEASFHFAYLSCINDGVSPKSYSLKSDAKYSLGELDFISTVCQTFKIFVLQNILQ